MTSPHPTNLIIDTTGHFRPAVLRRSSAILGWENWA